MDRNLALEVVRVTEAAAIASARLMGRGDQHGADLAAVEAMRHAFDAVAIRGEVVIGEGERDEAPMLYIGEKVGRWREGDPAIEIAVDPLEGTRLCASGAPNALSVIAMGEEGQLLRAPDVSMEKIAVGPGARGAIALDRSPTENLRAVARALGRAPGEVTVVVLERPRHDALVAELRAAGARVKLIPDGDVAAAIATCFPDSGVDLLMGTGGAPEGVISAAALRCVGGDLRGRLVFSNDVERARARAMGVVDLDRIMTAEELAGGNVMFAATGVTSGDFLRGVRFTPGGARTSSVVMRSRTGTIRYVDTVHRLDGAGEDAG
jgi:fructose-1,6-bisphosphatase II